MSALQFLNVMTQKISKEDTSKLATPKPKEKKQFKHGNNIIMKAGTYKGYYGYVYDYLPAKVEVEIEDQQYINAKVYGDQKIGSTIMTEFGESTIINKTQKTYILSLEKKEKQEKKEENDVESDVFTKEKTKKIQIRFNEDEILHVIQYTKNNKIRFGLFSNFENDFANVKPIQLNYSETTTKSELIDEMSKRIKENDFYIADVDQINKSDILFPELFFVKNGEYMGEHSINVQVVPEQYLITYKKQINLNKSQLKRQTSKLYQILSGPYKNKTAELIKVYPAHLVVYIDAAGKKVMHHMVKENDGYVQRYIYPSDVFYMDLVLTNGNLFEVKQITDDNVIIGLEKTDKGLIPRQITKNDIESLQPGFAFTKDTKQKMDLDETVYSYGDPMYEEKDFNEQDEQEDESEEQFEYTEENDVDEDVLSENGEEIESDENFKEEETLKSSYKDIERIAFEGEQLTKEQQKIRSRIEKITKTFDISTINEFKLIEQIEGAIQTVKKYLKTAKIDFWNISDEKYIIASLVLFEIIRSGQGSSIANPGEDTLTSFLNELISGSRSFFNKKDYIKSIFTLNNWTTAFEVNSNIFKSLVNSKDQVEIHKYIMKNCIALMETMYGKVNLEIKTKPKEDLFVLGKRKYEDEPKTTITIKDIFTNNISTSANKILWGFAYQPLLEKYKNKLIAKVNDPESNKTTKMVYDYVIQNLERGMFAIQEIKSVYEQSNSQLDKLKYEKMSKIWESLLNDAKIIYKKGEKERQQKIKDIEKQKQQLLTKRETISATKRLKSIGLENDEDEEIELKYERKFPSYLERIAKKRGF